MKEVMEHIGKKMCLSSRDCSAHEREYGAYWTEKILVISGFFCPREKKTILWAEKQYKLTRMSAYEEKMYVLWAERLVERIKCKEGLV